jgi:hypothetical protein
MRRQRPAHQFAFRVTRYHQRVANVCHASLQFYRRRCRA